MPYGYKEIYYDVTIEWVRNLNTYFLETSVAVIWLQSYAMSFVYAAIFLHFSLIYEAVERMSYL